MPTNLLHAFVISTQPYGEADRLITFFTQEKGKLTGIAKGVRRPTSKKRGSLEMFSQVRINMTDSKGLGIITEAQLISSFQLLRADLKKIAVAYFFCEVVKKISPEGEQNTTMYELLHEAFIMLSEAQNSKVVKDRFLWDILKDSGFVEHKTKEDPQKILDQVLEQKLSSIRVGKMLQ